MRRGMDAEVFVEDGKLYGFNLGADFTSEHEWGIDKLKRVFGVTNTKKKLLGIIAPVLGVDARTITEKPTDMLKSFEIYPFREDRHIFTAWDDGSFGILVDETYKKELADLYDAFNKKDIVFGMGRGNVFKNSGLLLIVRSAMSKEELYEKDLDYLNLQKAAEKTGIAKKLKEVGKKYYALSPRWKDETTKKEVIFWLNPMDQHIYNSGWYGIEELMQWANNEGPIIKGNRG